jgi:hypothetical protein
MPEDEEGEFFKKRLFIVLILFISKKKMKKP